MDNPLGGHSPQRDLPRPRLTRRSGIVREVVETLLLVVAIYALVNLSTARFVVEGRSMEPNFHSDEFVIVSRLAYIVGEPQRGDVVVFHYDVETKRDFIKRIIGLPGEHLQMKDGRVFINGVPLDEPYVLALCRSTTCREREWFLGEDEYFVLGDNRNSSQDSHDFGPIKRSQIVGRAWIRYWPPSDWTVISHHQYGPPPILPTPTITPTPAPVTPVTPNPMLPPEIPITPTPSLPPADALPGTL
jgi:signal peptidase I